MKPIFATLAVVSSLLLVGCDKAPEPVKNTEPPKMGGAVKGVTDENMAGASPEQREAIKRAMGKQ